MSLWKELISNYFRDNMLVGEYFNGQDEKFDKIKLEDQAKDEVVTIEKYIPINMNSNQGIRLNFCYIPNVEISDDYDIDIRSNEFLLLNTYKTKVMESETITVLKLLKRYGMKVRIPFTTRVAHEDMIFNFPTFLCKDIMGVEKVQKAMAELCMAWKKDANDRLISYSIKTNYNNDAICLSFAGHIDDFVRIFNSVGTTFPKREELNSWLSRIYIENNRFPIANMHPKIAEIMTPFGILRFKRKLVPKQYLDNIKLEDKCVTVSFSEKRDIVEEIVENKIGMAPVYIIKKTQCRKCNNDYLSCNCIKFIDDCAENIQEFEFAGVVWTNRHA